ncbi:response regulator [Rhizobium sp. NFR07]|uniref:response regulator n=1 Tax=Rhizobium sp. NFR07 TaxID=1566262 RepID=UPI000B80F0AD|nr:response regulator [Rhizobium sp. NFR07]
MNQSDVPSASPRTILVVEDEFFIALEIKTALISAGFNVLGPAASVDHALELMHDTKPDAAVLDVDLGGERVTPVAMQLTTLGTPFVLASAADPAALAQNAALAGVRNLGKPTDMQQLAMAVADIATA